MVSGTNDNPNNKRLKKQDQTVDSMLPHLPDLIVEKIFQQIPTKLAVRSAIVCKQWQAVWSLGVPFLDFDDKGDSPSDHGDDRRKLLFMDFVESCLRHWERNQLLELDSFRLRMRSYDCELVDSTRIDRWFRFSVDKCVKELDISIRRKDDNGLVGRTCYCIPYTILNAQYLTSLTLEHVRIPENIDLISLPLLKTMSLNAVLFDCYMNLSRSPWQGCPSIEHLSLLSCFLGLPGSYSWLVVISSSLKFLQVMNCECNSINIKAENLESFVLTSEFPQLGAITLENECVKLKYVSVSVQLSYASFGMAGTYRHNLIKATIDIPNLRCFSYDGYLLPNDVISLKARNPAAAFLKLDWDDEQVVESTFLPPWTHFPTWRDFLQNFACCNEVSLNVRHDAIAEALTFPENFKKTFSPPLLNIKHFWVSIVPLRCPQTLASISAFTDSLRWMAPYAMIMLSYYD